MLLWQLTINGLLAASVYALVAVGFGLIYRTTGFFNFAHGAVYTFGAYLAVTLNKGLGIPLALSVALATAGGAAMGALTELAVYRPLRRSGASELVLLLSSIAIFTIFQNLISAIFGDATTALRVVALSGVIEVLGARITILQVGIAAVAIGLCVGVTFLLWRTRFGNSILAVGADGGLAECSGIDSAAVTLQVFMLGSAMAALAGILVGMDTDITPLMGYSAMLNAVVAVVIGGTMSPLGWVVGAIVLGVAQHAGVWLIESHWQDTIAFGVLVVFMLIRPKGIVTTLETRV